MSTAGPVSNDAISAKMNDDFTFLCSVFFYLHAGDQVGDGKTNRKVGSEIGDIPHFLEEPL